MSSRHDILDGLSTRIDAAGIADYPWVAGGQLRHGAAVQWKTMGDVPDRVVLLTPFGTSADQPEITYGRIGVQFKFRGTDQVTDVDDLGDACFDEFHGLADVMLGDVHLIQMLRESSLPAGADTDERVLRADLYMLDVDYAATPLRPLA